MFSWLGANAGGIGIFVVAATFIWNVYQFMSVRQRDYEAREFEIYHGLIKDLVSPASSTEIMYADRQVAIIFELRGFKRYYEVTSRMLQGLKQNEAWSNNPRLMEEIDLTLSYICERMPSLSAHATTRGG
jgi:hypothetical protein